MPVHALNYLTACARDSNVFLLGLWESNTPVAVRERILEFLRGKASLKTAVRLSEVKALLHDGMKARGLEPFKPRSRAKRSTEKPAGAFGTAVVLCGLVLIVRFRTCHTGVLPLKDEACCTFGVLSACAVVQVPTRMLRKKAMSHATRRPLVCATELIAL